MAKRTLKVYATSTNDGKNLSEVYFRIGYMGSLYAMSADMVFDIPTYINSYNLKTFYVYVITRSASTVNLSGAGYKVQTLWYNGRLDISSSGAKTLALDNTISYSTRQLKYNFDSYEQFTDVDFAGKNHTDETKRPYLEIEYIEPSISGFGVDGSYIDYPVTCTWIQEDTISWTVQAILNGVVVASKSGTTEPNCVFNSGELSQVGKYTFKLTANNQVSTEITRDVTLNKIQPVVKDFGVVGTSIDLPINCSWLHTNVLAWTVQAILNGNIIASKHGSAEATCTFNAGEIPYKGNYVFKLIANNGSASVESTKDAGLTRVDPTIVSLEPDNVPQNINKQINLSWTTQNQQSYKLTVGGVTYNGTTATSLLLPSNTLTSGNKTMTLTITYTSSWGEVRTATKTVSFLAFGNPPNPVLDGTTIYNTALPTFTWIASEQVGYELKVRNSRNQDVIATDEVISLDKHYTAITVLDNNSNYTLLLRVKNQYNLWSGWSSKSFATSFVVPNTPTISLVTTNNSSIIVSFNIEYSSEFSKAEIWRKTDNSDWIRIAYNLDNTFSYEDRFVGNETYYYKVRAVGVVGGIAESEILSEALGELSPIRNFNLTNVENFNDHVVLVGNPTVRLTHNRQIVSTVFAGSKAPKIDKGETNYKSMSLSFSVKEDTYNKLIDVVDNANVLLYRDGRGRKFYCQLNSYPTISYDSGGYLGISFGIVEVAFLEGDFYSGSGNQPSLFFDGTWFFDGTVDLDGEV